MVTKTLGKHREMGIRWKTETGSGGKLNNVIKHDLVATNTLYNPQNNDKEKLVTWVRIDNNIKKQLA